MPPAVALLNYISSGKLWRIFTQTGIFAGFSLNTIDFAFYLCNFTQCVFHMHVSNTTNRKNIVQYSKKIKKAWSLRKTPQNDGYVYKYN